MNDFITSFICCKVAEASVEPAVMMNPRSTSGGIGSRITKNKSGSKFVTLLKTS